MKLTIKSLRCSILFYGSLLLLMGNCSLGYIVQPARFLSSSTPTKQPKITPTSALFTSRCDEYAELVRKPRWGGPILGPIVRRLNLYLVGSIFSIILKVLNRFKTHRLTDLMKYVWNRPKGTALLTVCNHQSVMDDPGLFTAFVPWWIIPFKKVRWSVCTEDVFFANKYVQKIMAAGNALPLDRSGSLEQPMFKFFQDKLDGGDWCHIFPEGRVWQSWRFDDEEVHLGKFKFGVGKILAHSKCPVIVVPFFHKGMDLVVPERQLKDRKSKKPSFPITVVPKRGKTIEMYVGKPLDFTKKIADFRVKYPGMLDSWQSTAETIDLYVEITNDIYTAMLEIEKEAWPKTNGVAKVL